jgi:multiple sugar transport system permease protein
VSKHRSSKSFISALPWIGPAILLILGVVVWPAIELVKISFTKINSAGQLGGFNGFENFKTLLANPNLPAIAVRTVIWMVLVVGITVIVSLPIAQLINQEFPGRKVVRWALIVPWAASVVMSSIIWKWIIGSIFRCIKPGT